MSSDEILSRAQETLDRVNTSRIMERSRNQQIRTARRAMGRVVMAIAAIIVGSIAWSALMGPLGLIGGVAVALIALFAVIALIMTGGEVQPTQPKSNADLARLPQQTENWLASQRPMLPPPAQKLADGIGVQLETLGSQLGQLPENDPAAFAIRRLIAEELPELVNGYAKVPEPFRRTETNGITPDKQLVDGLGVVNDELQRISTQLAAGDLTALATQGRYLELKYENGVS